MIEMISIIVRLSMKRIFSKFILLSLLILSITPSIAIAQGLFNRLVKNIGSFCALGIIIGNSYYEKNYKKSALNNQNDISSKDRILPAHIKKNLDEHALELQELLKQGSLQARMGYNVHQKDWLPGYYIKYGIKRVSNAQRFKAIIEKHNLYLLSVPEKYLYHVPGMPDAVSNENCLVIVKKVDGDKGKGQHLNAEQVKQLCIAAENAHHYDLHPANYVKRKDGTVVIIDTDEHAMPCEEKVQQLRNDWIQNGTRIHDEGALIMNPEIINHPLIKLELPMYSKWPNYDDKAFTYLLEKIKQVELERKKLK